MYAYKGRISMLTAIFGSGEKEKPKGPTASEIRTFAKTHNALMKHGRLRNLPAKARKK